MPRTITCPNCNTEIEHVNYNCLVKEHGRFYPPQQNGNYGEHETTDSGDSSNFSYECPECEYKLANNDSQMIKLYNANNINNKKPKQPPPLRQNQKHIKDAVQHKITNTIEVNNPYPPSLIEKEPPLKAKAAINPHNKLTPEEQDKFNNTIITICPDCNHYNIINKTDINRPMHLGIKPIINCVKCNKEFNALDYLLIKKEY